jgi:predicted transcriptional regulator
MRPPKSHKKIIEKLAFNPPLTIYRLSKETGYSTSTLHAAIKNLVSNRLVKKHKHGFALSFIGLVKYLASRFEDPSFDHNQISKIIKEYATINDCPLLTLHQAFQQWIGNEYYDHIASASYIINHLFETKIHITYIKAPKPIKRGEKIPIHIPTPSLEQEEKEWKHALALTFFNLTTTKPQTKLKQPQDQNIQNYLKKTLNQEITQKKKDIQKLKTTLQNLTQPQPVT